QTVGREAEEAVNPGETVRVEDRRLRKSFAALSARQHRGERRCIVTERGEARRAMAIGGAEALRELLPRLRRWGGEPAADQRRLAADVGGVPQPAAEQLHRLRLLAWRPDQAGELLQFGAAFRQQQRIEGGRRAGGVGCRTALEYGAFRHQ